MVENSFSEPPDPAAARLAEPQVLPDRRRKARQPSCRSSDLASSEFEYSAHQEIVMARCLYFRLSALVRIGTAIIL